MESLKCHSLQYGCTWTSWLTTFRWCPFLVITQCHIWLTLAKSLVATPSHIPAVNLRRPAMKQMPEEISHSTAWYSQLRSICTSVTVIESCTIGSWLKSACCKLPQKACSPRMLQASYILDFGNVVQGMYSMMPQTWQVFTRASLFGTCIWLNINSSNP